MQRIASLLQQRRDIIERVRHTPRQGASVAAIKEAKAKAASLMAEVERIETRERWAARFAS
jgi:hypothetical protein